MKLYERERSRSDVSYGQVYLLACFVEKYNVQFTDRSKTEVLGASCVSDGRLRHACQMSLGSASRRPKPPVAGETRHVQMYSGARGV